MGIVFMMPANLGNKPLSDHKNLLRWIEECARLTRSDQVVWCSGSDDEHRQLTELALAQRMLELLNLGAAAATEPANKPVAPDEFYKKLRVLFGGSLEDRTRDVVPALLVPARARSPREASSEQRRRQPRQARPPKATTMTKRCNFF
jgi:GTP-dependent phosphoenolpyruvate carboxykinase